MSPPSQELRARAQTQMGRWEVWCGERVEVLFDHFHFCVCEKASGKEYGDNGCLNSKYKVCSSCLREQGREQTVATRHASQVTSRASVITADSEAINMMVRLCPGTSGCTGAGANRCRERDASSWNCGSVKRE